MPTFADNVTAFLFNLKLPFKLPHDIEVLDVHKMEAVQQSCGAFYQKFYDDHHVRRMLIGINPGRFGGGVTGIPFTDPIRLQDDCGIHNNFSKKQELSSVFMYEMIEASGGVKEFYNRYYFTAVSPLGFIRNNKNLNYYDDKILLKCIEPFVVECMRKQIAFGIEQDICFCIGEGDNFKYFSRLNEKHKWFDQIKTLSHPRFIMQYKLKQKEAFINQYIKTLRGNF